MSKIRSTEALIILYLVQPSYLLSIVCDSSFINFQFQFTDLPETHRSSIRYRLQFSAEAKVKYRFPYEKVRLSLDHPHGEIAGESLFVELL